MNTIILSFCAIILVIIGIYLAKILKELKRIYFDIYPLLLAMNDNIKNRQ